MEYFPKNDNKNNFYNSSSFLLNKKGKNCDYSINEINIKNKDKIKLSNSVFENNNNNNEKNSLMNKSLYYTYSNMFRFINYTKPMSTRINSLLIDFNKELSKNNNEKENKSKLKNEFRKNNINKYEPLIKKLESMNDERFKQSRFLKFIKDIN